MRAGLSEATVGSLASAIHRSARASWRTLRATAAAAWAAASCGWLAGTGVRSARRVFALVIRRAVRSNTKSDWALSLLSARSNASRFLTAFKVR